MGIELGKVYRTSDGRYVVTDRVEPHDVLDLIRCWVEDDIDGWVVRYYMGDGDRWAKTSDNECLVDDIGDDEAAVVRAEYALWAGED